MSDQAPSASIQQPDYWWYRARSALLAGMFQDRLAGASRILDVGSADGPSVAWLRRSGAYVVSLDIDPQGLDVGGVCGSALSLPFRGAGFDVVTAFDVLEHCDPEATALAEFRRVLRPGGRMLLSVPGYEWAWSKFDVDAGHHRRYTRARLRRAAESAGFRVERTSYIFASTLPLFAVERLVRKVEGRRGRVGADLTPVSERVDRILTRVCAAEARVLARFDLPFGSSVVLTAVKPR